MKGRTCFGIPECGAPEIMANLVMAVPSNWSLTLGRLVAPKELIINGRVAATSGYLFQHHQDYKLAVVGLDSLLPNLQGEADYCAMMVEHKMPKFVVFQGIGDDSLPLEIGKKVAAYYLRQGYQGDLEFIQVNAVENPASFGIVADQLSGDLESWEFLKQMGLPPSRLALRWNSEATGDQPPDDLKEILDICRGQNLKECDRKNRMCGRPQ